MSIFNFNKKKPESAKEIVKEVVVEEKFNSYFDSFKTQVDYSNPVISDRYNVNGYVPFDTDNLYPQFLNKIYQNSPINNSIINFKKFLIAGNGYTTDVSKLRGMDLIKYNQMILQFANGKSIDEILEELTLNFLLHSAIYIKITWNDNFTQIIKREFLPCDKIRSGAINEYGEITKYYYNFNWQYQSRYKTIELAAFNKQDKTNKVQLYTYKVPCTTNDYYPLSSWTAAANWAYMDWQISFLHKSNIEQSVNPSMIIKFYKKPGTPELRRKVMQEMEESMAGKSGYAKLWAFFSDGKENSPDIMPAPVNNLDKQFVVTATEIQRNICYSHSINPLILGIKTPGSLGNGTELGESYMIFNNCIIKPTQKQIENVINNLFLHSGLNINFRLNNKSMMEV